MTQEALKLALEALYPISHNTTDDPRGQAYKAITAIKEALAQTQEPWCMKMNGCKTKCEDCPVEAAQPEQEPVAVYGYCPECGAKGVMRERRPNGNDKCANGHTYPSSKSTSPQPEPVAFENWHKANYVQNLERYGDTYKNNHVRCRHQGWLGAQSSSPQRTWVGLAAEDRLCAKYMQDAPDGIEAVIDYIEAKLKQKNGYAEENT